MSKLKGAYIDRSDFRRSGSLRGESAGGSALERRQRNVLRAGHAHQGWFASAVKRCEKADPTLRRVTPLDLRHTAASLAINAGANVKVVQRMLGHKSAKVTLDTCAAPFPDDLDNVTEELSRQRAGRLPSRGDTQL